MVERDDDPGWRFDKDALVVLVPGLNVRYLNRSGQNGQGLSTLRALFLTYCLSLVLVGTVVVLVAGVARSGTAAFVWLGVIAAYDLTILMFVGRTEKPLDCANDAALAASYRTRFFLRIAFAEAGVLFAFVATFIAPAGAWLFLASVVLASPGFARAAPTRKARQRDQAELHARGCGRSLVAALQSVPPSSA